MRNKNQKISKIILDFLQSIQNDTFTFFDLINTLKERSFGILLLLIALPNALLVASIPGISTLFGLFAIFVSFQMILQRKKIWLPKILGQKKISKKKFYHMVMILKPYFSKIENKIKPRWVFLTSFFFEMMTGIICLIHSVMIFLPIPFGNFLSGISLVFLALGTIYKDGLFIVMGYILSLGIFMLFLSIFIKLGTTIAQIF